jgi:hypothetical protein
MLTGAFFRANQVQKTSPTANNWPILCLSHAPGVVEMKTSLDATLNNPLPLMLLE